MGLNRIRGLRLLRLVLPCLLPLLVVAAPLAPGDHPGSSAIALVLGPRLGLVHRAVPKAQLVADLKNVPDATVEAIARRLFHEMALRVRRRQRSSRRRGRVSLRRTIRKSMGSGGEPVVLLHNEPRPKKQRLIVLLDVSGSMDRYSFYLLRFILAMKAHFRQMEAFIFSTSLVRISRALMQDRLDLVLERISGMADQWSGGTRIGASLREFHDRFGKRMLNGSPLLVIMSDGLDTGDVGVLREEMNYLQRRVRKVVWLNPLKGMEGYAPTARGMEAALPHVDEFRTAHNLQSILELENLLMDA